MTTKVQPSGGMWYLLQGRDYVWAVDVYDDKQHLLTHDVCLILVRVACLGCPVVGRTNTAVSAFQSMRSKPLSNHILIRKSAPCRVFNPCAVYQTHLLPTFNTVTTGVPAHGIKRG